MLHGAGLRALRAADSLREGMNLLARDDSVHDEACFQDWSNQQLQAHHASGLALVAMHFLNIKCLLRSHRSQCDFWCFQYCNYVVSAVVGVSVLLFGRQYCGIITYRRAD